MTVHSQHARWACWHGNPVHTCGVGVWYAGHGLFIALGGAARVHVQHLLLVPSAYGGLGRASHGLVSAPLPRRSEQPEFSDSHVLCKARCMLQPACMMCTTLGITLNLISNLNLNLSAQARPRSTLFTGSQRVAEQLTADLHGKARHCTKGSGCYHV